MLNQKPELDVAFSYLKKCPLKWKEIGTFMKLEQSYIDQIDINQQLQVRERVRSMLITFETVLESKYTWRALIEALKKANENAIAFNIEEDLKKKYPPSCN